LLAHFRRPESSHKTDVELGRPDAIAKASEQQASSKPAANEHISHSGLDLHLALGVRQRPH
jgi:hypothetical protein